MKLFSIFLACPMILTFTIGVLGVAAFIGLGNGADVSIATFAFDEISI